LTEQERVRYLGMSEQQRFALSEEERWRWHEARRLTGGYNYETSGQYGATGQYGSTSQYGTTGSQYGTGVAGSQFGTGVTGGQYNFSEQDRLRYSKMTDKDLLGLPEEERLRWNEFRRSSGMGGQNYSTNYSQQGLGGQGMQYSNKF